jgi:hypothetical protein
MTCTSSSDYLFLLTPRRTTKLALLTLIGPIGAQCASRAEPTAIPASPLDQGKRAPGEFDLWDSQERHGRASS